MDGPIPTKLRFNFGFLLEASHGTKRTIELDYPKIQLDDVLLAPLNGSFTATRTSSGLYFQGKLQSSVISDCSRCLEDVSVPTSFDLDAMFFYPVSAAPAGEFAIEEDGVVDLSHFVRELSLLEVPIHVVCREDCNGLCKECGINLNEESCDCEKDEIDPRFAALKQLLDQQE